MIDTGFETMVDVNAPRNFLSVDKLVAINSSNEYFGVGEIVVRDTYFKFEIIQFTTDEESNEILVFTDGGMFYLDTLSKLEDGL